MNINARKLQVSDADNLETAVTKPTGDVLPRMRARKLQGQKTVTRTKTGNGIHKTKKVFLNILLFLTFN